VHPRVGELGAGSIMLENAALKAAPAPARRSAQRGLEVAQAAVVAKAVGTSCGTAAVVADIAFLHGLHEQYSMRHTHGFGRYSRGSCVGLAAIWVTLPEG
jgi:hypothetical protein